MCCKAGWVFAQQKTSARLSLHYVLELMCEGNKELYLKWQPEWVTEKYSIEFHTSITLYWQISNLSSWLPFPVILFV